MARAIPTDKNQSGNQTGLFSKSNEYCPAELRDNCEAQTTNFGQELEFLKCYLDIERTRFQDRLIVELDVDQEALDVKVPNLILQPIVENAIQHGVARQSAAGRLTIRAFKRNDRLTMQIEDDGPGLSTNGNSGGGIGLSNTRARLDQFYGGEYTFEIANSANRGVVVTIEIPAFVEGKNEA